MKAINMKEIKVIRLLMGLIELLVGILLLLNPVEFTTGIIILLGIVLVFIGIRNIVGYFRAEPQAAAQEKGLTKGLLYISGGCACMFQSGWFLAAFPLITVFYGILIFISGIHKVQWTVDMLRQKRKYWFLALIGAVLSMVFAVLTLANPFSSTAILWTFIAISLIIEAVVDILTFIFGRK